MHDAVRFCQGRSCFRVNDHNTRYERFSTEGARQRGILVGRPVAFLGVLNAKPLGTTFARVWAVIDTAERF
jgi:hypothetical protein